MSPMLLLLSKRHTEWPQKAISSMTPCSTFSFTRSGGFFNDDFSAAVRLGLDLIIVSLHFSLSCAIGAVIIISRHLAYAMVMSLLTTVELAGGFSLRGIGGLVVLFFGVRVFFARTRLACICITEFWGPCLPAVGFDDQDFRIFRPLRCKISEDFSLVKIHEMAFCRSNSDERHPAHIVAMSTCCGFLRCFRICVL